MPAGTEGIIVSSFNVGELFRFGTEVDVPSGKRAAEIDALEKTLLALVRALWELPEDRTAVVWESLGQSFLEKNALAWVAERTFEGMVVRGGWAGTVAGSEAADYLAVVSSDIGRTPRGATVQNIFKEIIVSEEGELSASVVVEFVRAFNETTVHDNDAGGYRYVRVYVPRGSELLDASGFISQDDVLRIDYEKEKFSIDADLAAMDVTHVSDEWTGADIFEESGKTVFGGWVESGDSRIILSFLLPADQINGEFPSVFQKQPGTEGKLHFSVGIPGAERFELQENFLFDKTVNVVIP